MQRNVKILLAAAVAVSTASVAQAEKKYGPGVTDTEIKIGNIMPYSGPASAYGVIGKTEAAYINMINEKGGINGRKINFRRKVLVPPCAVSAAAGRRQACSRGHADFHEPADSARHPPGLHLRRR